MIKLNTILNEIVGDKNVYIKNIPQTTTLTGLINKIVFDTDKLVVNNLKTLYPILKKETLTDDDKEFIRIVLSNYQRYFDQTNGGTPELNRSQELITQLQQLVQE